MPDLTDLIARLEKEPSGSLALDREVWEAVAGDDASALEIPPAYTVSLDRALTLVPKGRYVKLQIDRTHDRAWVWVELDDVEAVAHATPALALVIAALKARQAAS